MLNKREEKVYKFIKNNDNELEYIIKTYKAAFSCSVLRELLDEIKIDLTNFKDLQKIKEIKQELILSPLDGKLKPIGYTIDETNKLFRSADNTKMVIFEKNDLNGFDTFNLVGDLLNSKEKPKQLVKKPQI